MWQSRGLPWPRCATPNRHHQDSPAWGGIVGPLAWALWVYFEDREALERVYPVLRGYLRYLEDAVRDDILRHDGRDWLFLGDWVAVGRGMDSGREPDHAMRELVNTCYLVYLWQFHARIAGVLDLPDAVQESGQRVDALQRAIHRTFFDAERGIYLLPEQTYQVMPLATGVVPADLQKQVHQRLLAMIKDDCHGHLDTGMPGTTFLLEYLIWNEEHDILAGIIGQETESGWGHMLASGGTAFWEQWNGYWSQIHSTFTGVACWFYAGLAGIRPDERAPGFRHFFLKPAFLDRLDFVEARYETIRGCIESGWKRSGGVLRWRVTIPPNTTATLSVPCADPGMIRLDGVPLDSAPDVLEYAREQNGTRFRLGSGTYQVDWVEGGMFDAVTS